MNLLIPQALAYHGDTVAASQQNADPSQVITILLVIAGIILLSFLCIFILQKISSSPSKE